MFILDRECFVRALHTSASHSSAGVFGGVFEHFRDVLDPADPASGFDLLFHLASRVAKGEIFEAGTASGPIAVKMRLII